MIDERGVKQMVNAWAWQRRRIWLGGYRDRQGLWHEDGWTRQSVVSKFKDLFDGAGSSTRILGQFREEGLTGDALLVSRAMQSGMPEVQRIALFTAHVVPDDMMKLDERLDVLWVAYPQYKWGRSNFFVHCGNAKSFLLGRLSALDVPRGAQNPDSNVFAVRTSMG